MDDDAQKDFKELLSKFCLKEINYLSENFKHIACYESLFVLLCHSTHKVQ